MNMVADGQGLSSIRFRALMWSAALVVMVGCAQRQLPLAATDRLQQATIPDSAVGVAVLDANSGATLYEFNARQALQPASTIKTLTAIVALETLGPAFRARVELRAAAPVDGVIKGPVALVGQGSVDFNSDALRRMLALLRARGVRAIEGDVVLDRDGFQPARPDLGVPPFDESPEFQYNVIPDALLLNMNLVGLELSSKGGVLAVRLLQPLDGVRVTPGFTLIDSKCADWEDGWLLPEVVRGPEKDASIEIRLRGTFPKDCTASTQINVLDRTDFADRLFRTLWREAGGSFNGVVREKRAADVLPSAVQATHTGRPLADIVRDINKRSDNPVTRVAYLHLGRQRPVEGAVTTAESSERVVREWMKAKGIDDTGVVLDNGSGLSRTERIPAYTLARVFLEATRSKWSAEFLSSLPIVGVDGAMRVRLATTHAREWGRFKTGTLRNTTALVGISPGKRGNNLVLAIIVNHDRAVNNVARPIADALAEWVLENF